MALYYTYVNHSNGELKKTLDCSENLLGTAVLDPNFRIRVEVCVTPWYKSLKKSVIFIHY